MVAAVATNERFPNSVESEMGDMDDGMFSSSSSESPIASELSSSSFENSRSMQVVDRKRSHANDDDENFDQLTNENQDENRCPRKQARLDEQDLTNIKSIEEMLVNECSSLLATGRNENNRFEAELSPSSSSSSSSRINFEEDFFQTIELFDTSESLNHQTVEFDFGLEDTEFNFNFQTDYFNNSLFNNIYQQTNLV